jgi:hypothetical protein
MARVLARYIEKFTGKEVEDIKKENPGIRGNRPP